MGSAGDVHPMLGLALELRNRGHKITFVTNGYFRELVERHGLEYVELGTKEQFLESANHPDLWHPTRSFPYIFRSGLQPSLRPHFEIHRDRFVRGRTVAIGSCLGLGARVAQEVLQMPLVTVHLQPSVLWSNVEPPKVAKVFGPRWLQSILYAFGERMVIDKTVCPELNALRAEFSLPPMKRTTRWWHSPDLVVCMFPEWFAPKQPDWPPNTVQTDFPLWDDDADAQLSAEVESFLAAGTPPIIFTPGSANLFGSAFFQAAVDACERLGRRGLLLTRFSEQIPKSLSANVRHFSYVAFKRLLPRSAALVHHGGIGSTAQALAAGIPQLVMPLAHDQFDNAARLKRHGAGDFIKVSQFRGPAVAALLGKLLASDGVKQTCRAAAERLAPNTGLRKSADEIEAFAQQVEIKSAG
jgi:UDP:flavonoid glycosyltransferase YjiC (YdhE family)